VGPLSSRLALLGLSSALQIWLIK